MVLKTFNLDANSYEKFSSHCKKHGISMSKKIENFIKSELENFGFKEKKEILKKTYKRIINYRKNEKSYEHPLCKYC